MRRAWVYCILVIASLLVPTLAQAQTINAGGVPITDGASSTLLVAEQIQTISCGDTDGDGRIGILRVELLLRDVRTGDLVTAFIVPADGELDDNEEEEVTIVIGALTLVGTVEPRFFVYGTELPR